MQLGYEGLKDFRPGSDDPADLALQGLHADALVGFRADWKLVQGVLDERDPFVVGYGAQNNYRIQWKTAMSNECPWYVWEVPTVMVSLNFTTHLHDATMVKCYINAYHSNPENLKQVVDKIMGESEFKGKPNDLVWAGK